MRWRGKWWLRVLGKGVYGEVPLRDELMAEFARYRTFHYLPPTPSALDPTPVILSIAGRSAECLTPTAVYLIVKDVFSQAADAITARDQIHRRRITPRFDPLAASHRGLAPGG